MFKKYLLSKITEASAFIGVAFILSVIFLPKAVSIGLGTFLIFTPDRKLNAIIENFAIKIKKILK